MHAEGVKKVKEEIAEIFCKTILGLKELPDEGGKVPYDLRCLKDANFPFSTEPKDQVLNVDLKLFRLDLPFDKSKGSGRRIVLSATSLPGAPNALHRLMGEAIDQRRVPLDDVVVSQAKLKFTFRADNGRQPKTQTMATVDRRAGPICETITRQSMSTVAIRRTAAADPTGLRVLQAWEVRMQEGRAGAVCPKASQKVFPVKCC